MAKRLPWGHESRHCIYCGKVGPRTVVLGGYAHKYCLPKPSKRLSVFAREIDPNVHDEVPRTRGVALPDGGQPSATELVGWLADDGGSMRAFFRHDEADRLDEFVAAQEPLEVFALYRVPGAAGVTAAQRERAIIRTTWEFAGASRWIDEGTITAILVAAAGVALPDGGQHGL